jgi:hypothetical protein
LLWWVATWAVIVANVLKPWQGTPKGHPKEGMGEIMAMAAGDSGCRQSAPPPSLLLFLAALLSMLVGDVGKDDGGGGSSQMVAVGEEGGGEEGQQMRQWMHRCCNGVKQEKKIWDSFFMLSLAKAELKKTLHLITLLK